MSAVRGETQFPLDLPATMTAGGWENSLAAISSDGRRIVYRVGRGPQAELYLRSLDDITTTRIEGTQGAENPFFASDGQWVGFFVNDESTNVRQLRKVNLLGGRWIKICDAPGPGPPFGATWRDDTIVFSADKGLVAVNVGSGTPRQLTTVPASVRGGGHRSPVLLPGGRAAVYTVAPAVNEQGSLEAVELESGKRMSSSRAFSPKPPAFNTFRAVIWSTSRMDSYPRLPSMFSH